MNPVTFRHARVDVTASWPWIDLHEVKVGYAAQAHCRLPIGICFRDLNRGDKIREPNRCLTRLNAVDDDSLSTKVHKPLKAPVAFALSRVVVANKTQFTLHSIARLVAQNVSFFWLD